MSTSGSRPSPPVRGPMHGMMGGPPVKAVNFKGSMRRLVARLRDERRLVAAAGVLGIVSVALSVIGPKILGNATDLIFEGLIGGRLPAGATEAQAVAQLSSEPSAGGRIADTVSAMDVCRGAASTLAPSAASCSPSSCCTSQPPSLLGSRGVGSRRSSCSTPFTG